MTADVLAFPKGRKFSRSQAAQIVDLMLSEHYCPVCGGRFVVLSQEELQELWAAGNSSPCVIARLAYEGDSSARSLMVEYVMQHWDISMLY